jgi:hypothetical protein
MDEFPLVDTEGILVFFVGTPYEVIADHRGADGASVALLVTETFESGSCV